MSNQPASTHHPEQSTAHVTSVVITPEAEAARRRTRLRKLAVSVIVVSICLHLVGGIAAFFWVIARYFEKPKAQFEVVRQLPVQPEKRKQQMETEQVASLRPKPVFDSRIQSLRPTEFALPDMPELPVDQLVEIDTDSLLNEQIEVTAESQSEQGAGEGGGFLGGSGRAGSGLLEGTFYDLKQTPGRDPTGMDEMRYKKTVSDFAKSFDPQVLAPFYQAPRKLYLTRVAIPKTPADQGPSAFKVQSRVQPNMWLVHYRGHVIAPESGTFRFVGLGDDVLLVRFDGRLVFDGSWEDWNDFSHLDRSERYPKPDLDGWLDLYVGRNFTVQQGERYPIEVVLGERPGGDMLMALFIEKAGVAYPKNKKTGAPILPLFQMSDRPLPASVRRQLPEFLESSPVWRPSPEPQSFFFQ